MQNIDELLKLKFQKQVVIPQKVDYTIENTLKNKNKYKEKWRDSLKKKIAIIVSTISILAGGISVYAVNGGKIFDRPVFEWIGIKFPDNFIEYKEEQSQELVNEETKIDLVSTVCDDGITILEFDIKLSKEDREYLRLDKSIITEEDLEEAKKQGGLKYNLLYNSMDILNTVELTFFNVKQENKVNNELYKEDGTCSLLIDGKKVYTKKEQTSKKISDYEYKVYQMYFLPEEKIENKKEFTIKLENIMLGNKGEKNKEDKESYYVVNTGHNQKKIKIDGYFEVKVSKEKALKNTNILKTNIEEIKYKNMTKKVEEVKLTPMQIIVKLSTQIDNVSLQSLSSSIDDNYIGSIEFKAYDNNNNDLNLFNTEIKRVITYKNGTCEEWALGDIGTYKDFNSAKMNMIEYIIIEKNNNINDIRIETNVKNIVKGEEIQEKIGEYNINLLTASGEVQK